MRYLFGECRSRFWLVCKPASASAVDLFAVQNRNRIHQQPESGELRDRPKDRNIGPCALDA